MQGTTSKTTDETGERGFRANPALPVGVLAAVYVALTFFPLAAAWLQGRGARGFYTELSSGLALTAFSVLLLQFLSSGRFRTTTGIVGIDITMLGHQLVARTLTLLLVLHPFLYLARRAGGEWGRSLLRMFTSPANLSGVGAWLVLLVVVFAAVFRDRLPVSYELWRASHGFGALLVAAGGVHHAFSVGRYTPGSLIGAFWLLLLAVSALSLLTVYVVRPLALRNRPFEVVDNRRVGENLWELTVAPADSFEPRLQAGQFFWVTVGDSPFSLREHPFSAASAPEELPRIRFLINEAGDFTDTIGSVSVGTRAYLDGPYGIFTADERDAPGLAFVAGGVGIAPILGILRHLRAQEYSRPVRLLYGTRDLEHAVYTDELEAMTDPLDFRFELVLSNPQAEWQGARGILDRSHLEEFFDEDGFREWTYFVCGPNVVLRSAGLALEDMGIPGRNIVSERFRFG